MRNALLPVITTIGLQTGGLLAGAVLTETVFNFGGIGSTLAQAFTQRDYAVLQVLILAAAIDLRHRQPPRRHLVRRHRPEGAHPMSPATPSTAASSGSTTSPPARSPGRARAASGAGAGRSRRRRGTVDDPPASRSSRARGGGAATPCSSSAPASPSLFIVLAVVSPWIAPHDAAGSSSTRCAASRTPSRGRSPASRWAPTTAAATCSRACSSGASRRSSSAWPRRSRPAGGLVLGLLAGAFGGGVDAFVMRAVDVLLSIPSLLLAVSIAALARQPSQWTVIVAIASSRCRCSPACCAGRCSPSARATTCSRPVPWASAAGHHLPPHGAQLAGAGHRAGDAGARDVSIIDAAALSFLGLGNPDDAQPEWGQMLGQAQQYIYDHPHLAVYPALCIVFVALGFTLMGESLREALDPKSRR